MPPDRALRFDPIAEARRQWLAHDWDAAEAMAAATSIMRAQQIIVGRVDAALRPFKLTFARFEALVLLYFSRRGSLPMGKMGQRLMVHPTSVTNAIDRLEEQGLVRRISHPTDRRATLAEITKEGRRVAIESARAVCATAFGFEDYSGRQSAEITQLLRKLRQKSGDFDEDVAPER